jgi:hypothetical protein
MKASNTAIELKAVAASDSSSHACMIVAEQLIWPKIDLFLDPLKHADPCMLRARLLTRWCCKDLNRLDVGFDDVVMS